MNYSVCQRGFLAIMNGRHADFSARLPVVMIDSFRSFCCLLQLQLDGHFALCRNLARQYAGQRLQTLRMGEAEKDPLYMDDLLRRLRVADVDDSLP